MSGTGRHCKPRTQAMTHGTVYRFPRCYLSSTLLCPRNGVLSIPSFKGNTALDTDTSFLFPPVSDCRMYVPETLMKCSTQRLREEIDRRKPQEVMGKWRLYSSSFVLRQLSHTLLDLDLIRSNICFWSDQRSVLLRWKFLLCRAKKLLVSKSSPHPLSDTVCPIPMHQSLSPSVFNRTTWALWLNSPHGIKILWLTVIW